MERVLWDYDSTRRESQRLGLGYHQPICPEESWEQGGWQGVQADSVDDGGDGPQRGVQAARNNEASVPGPSEEEAGGLQEWAWYPPREAEMDSGGSLGRVEARHSEAWAIEPDDLERHWLGETEDASEELLHTFQEPGEKVGRPRPHGASGGAPRELVFQHSEHEDSLGRKGNDNSRAQHQADLHGDEDRDVEMVEAERPQLHGVSSEALREQVLQGDEGEGWPCSCKRAQRQVDLSRRAGRAVSKKRKLPSGSERASEAKRRPAQCPSCEARTCEFITEWVSGGRHTNCSREEREWRHNR